MAGSAARLLPVAVPVLLVGSLAMFGPIAQQQSASLCAVPVGDTVEDARLDAAQVSNARIVVAVGVQLELPARAAVIAVATAMQESSLRNLPGGDRDSAGLFQQRPSQDWGSYAEVTDPVRSAMIFYRRLAASPGWEVLPLTVAAQAVQRSAHPTAYARWEIFATDLVSRLSDGPLTDNCAATEPVVAGASVGRLPAEQMGADGLTPRTRRVLIEIVRAFGVTEIGGFCPGGCTSGHIAGSDHYTGHAIDVMLLPLTEANRRLGDRIAAWLVANSRELEISYLIWRDHIWSAQRATEGWRPYDHPSGSSSATLRHLDHIHVSAQ
jgi:hypothetical protein